MHQTDTKKLIFCLYFLAFGFSEPLKAQYSSPADSLTREARQYFDNAQEQQALDIYLKVLDQEAKNFEALWYTSFLYAREGFRLNDESEMMEYYQKSLEYAEIVLEKYPDEGYSHFVYAIAHGRISDLSKNKTRIRKSYIVKEHAQKAVEKLPDYAPAWLLLGIWHSKVANVGSVQKLAANIISKGLPDGASNDKAEEYIKKALELDPDQAIRFKLDLGRHYRRAGDSEKAEQTLREVLKLEPQNEIDEWNLERAERILKEMN